MTTVLDRPGLLILPFRPVERFHMAGKHNQKSHGKGGNYIADVGDTVSSKDGKVSGAVVSEYMAYKNKTTGEHEDWLKVETTGKKKWYQDSELSVVTKGPHGVARTEWVQTKTGGMLEAGQVLKTPNGVGEFVKTMHDKDGYWVYANVPGSKKKWFKTEEVQAGVANGKGVKYQAPGGGGAASVVPKTSVSAPPAISKSPAPSVTSGGKTYTVGGSVLAGGSSAKITEVQGQWVKVDGPGKKKWYKADELSDVPATQHSSPHKHHATTVGQHPKNQKYSTIKYGDQKWESAADAWISTLSASERKSIVHYTGTGYEKINLSLRHGDGSNQHVKPIDAALAKSKVPVDVQVYRGTKHHSLTTAKVGDIFEDKGYVSTSTSDGAAFSGHKLTMRIPAGSTGGYVNSISQHPGERELLLPRGSRFKIISVTEKPGAFQWTDPQKHFVMELIP